MPAITFTNRQCKSRIASGNINTTIILALEADPNSLFGSVFRNETADFFHSFVPVLLSAEIKVTFSSQSET